MPRSHSSAKRGAERPEISSCRCYSQTQNEAPQAKSLVSKSHGGFFLERKPGPFQPRNLASKEHWNEYCLVETGHSSLKLQRILTDYMTFSFGLSTDCSRVLVQHSQVSPARNTSSKSQERFQGALVPVWDAAQPGELMQVRKWQYSITTKPFLSSKWRTPWKLGG